MENFSNLKKKIKLFAEKYALDNLGLDEKTYRKVLNNEIQKNCAFRPKSYLKPVEG
jgi:hypothetical protein